MSRNLTACVERPETITQFHSNPIWPLFRFCVQKMSAEDALRCKRFLMALLMTGRKSYKSLVHVGVFSRKRPDI